MISLNKALSAKLLFCMALASLLSACSMFGDSVSDDGIDYKSTVKHQSLEIPPDLSRPTTNDAMSVDDLENQQTTYSAYHGSRQQAGADTSSVAQSLPEQQGIRYVHRGPYAWLEVSGTVDQIWPRVREFWLKTGFVLVEDSRETGIMETEWAENRANIPKGVIRNLLSKVLAAAYTSGTRDKFRVRIEQVDGQDKLELFISHRGMVERVVGTDLSSEGSVWEVRPSDPDLEAAMLKRLMMHLGVPRSEAETVLATTVKEEKARLDTSGERPVLIVNSDFSRSWRLLGLALDRVSFTVVDRDRSRGIYYVKYSDPDRTASETGLLSRLKFWSDKKTGEELLYQVTMQDETDKVRVVVNNDKGEAENSSTAERILKLLHEQLK